MICGDFANSMMQTVVPSIMPLKFKALGASNVLTGLFATSIPSFLAVYRDTACECLLKKLNKGQFLHPETQARMIFRLV